MKFKQRLRLNAVVSAISMLAILLVIFMMAYRVNRALEKAKIADAIIIASYKRLVLRTDNHRTGSERSKVQFIAKHKQVGDLLKVAAEKFSNPDDKKTVNELLTIHASLGKLSKANIENREKRGLHTRPDELSQELEDRLTSQLNMMNYDTILLDSKLLEASKADVSSSLKLAGGGIFLMLLLVSAATLNNSWAMGRAITERVARLREGAAVIGSGDLKHRIDSKGDDEFAELSAAFNAMTARLSGSYNELECEVKERARAEEELRLAYGRLQTFFDHRIGGIGIVIANAEGNIIQANDYYLNILGHTREELLAGQVDWRRMTPPEWLSADECALDQLRERGVCDTYEKEYVHQDGSRVPVLITDAMMPGECGDILAFILEITERKQAEQALQKAHDELEKQVEERTRELHEKEVLLKEIHHRVKNNLQVISSLVGLQANGSQDESVRDVLRDVTDRVRSMALVHEKLYQSSDLSRIDFGEYTRGLLAYLWRAHGNVAAAVHLTLDLESVALPIVSAVPCGLILNELAGNALKHAFRGRDEGEVVVSLHTGRDGRIRLSVRDNGVGLPPGFDWRKSNSLGLHLVQMLSGQLDADVEVTGGEGTRFEIVI
jgi:PAS domain S-box-containing protein